MQILNFCFLTYQLKVFNFLNDICFSIPYKGFLILIRQNFQPGLFLSPQTVLFVKAIQLQKDKVKSKAQK